MKGPPPVAGLIAFDVAYVVVLTAVVGLPAAGLWAMIGRLPAPWGPVALVPAAGVLVVAVLAQIAVLQRLRPRLVPGVHALPDSPEARVWLASLMLRRIALHPWWGQVVMGSPALRWLALTALGARVSYRSSMSSDVIVLDPGLLETGLGSVIGTGCLLGGHAADGDRLVLGGIVIGTGAELHARVGVGPGCRIGADARVRSEVTMIADVEVGEGAMIGARSLLQPGVRVGAGAKVGDNCVLEHGARVADGAVVPAGTRVPRGAVVEAAPR